MLSKKLLLTPFALWMVASEVIAQTPKELKDGILITTLESVGIASTKLHQLDSLITVNEFKNVTSILIAKSGKLVYEKYYNRFSVNSKHDTRSATKTVTSILMGLAIDKKFIPSEQTPILKYFKDKEPIQNPDLRKEKITIEDLLTMSSMLECDDENQYSSGNEERMYLTEDYIKFALNLPIKGFASFATKPSDDPYGRAFSYCTAGTLLLGSIIERSSKMKIDKFAKHYLFDELGIDSVEWQITPMGMPMTGGGLRMKSRDFIKLGMLFASKGKWNDKQLISTSWVANSIKPHTNARENVDYGYLWWLQKFGSANASYFAHYMAGNGGNKIAIFPELDMVVVVTSNWYGTGKAHAQSEKIISEFIIPSLIR